MSEEQAQLTIGALSRATGVPTETLRTWERRYGFPRSERTETGHRRYPLQTVERLRTIVAVLALGHRPSTVLSADETSLRALLAERGPSGSSTPASSSGVDPRTTLDRWFEHVERFEGRALEREFRRVWNETGARAFMRRFAAPFLSELGERWADGRLGVRHEHFASERLREFLTGQWRPMSDAATGATYVLATLPGERHVLGLHLVALCVALSGGRIVFLGADTPAEEIVAAAEHHAAAAVLISAAQGCDRARMVTELERIRAGLDDSVAVRTGGEGFRGVSEPAPPFLALSELEAWLSSSVAP